MGCIIFLFVRKFFHDALPTVGTAASVALMRDLIQRNDVSGAEAELWLTSMAFINKPTKEMLKEATPLLDSSKYKSALSVSSLVNTYCRDNPECGETREVQEIMRVLEKKLVGDCQSENHEDVLFALKSIGNAGHAESLVPTLNRCINNAENSMEIRVAAINAFRRMACTAEVNTLEALYKLL